MKKSGYGVLYIASGRQHFEEALASYESLLKVHKRFPMAMVTDPENSDHKVFKKSYCRVIVSEKMTKSTFDKPFFIEKSPFEKTLVLDTDTKVLCSIKPMFDILNCFDLAMTLDTSRGKIYYPPPKYNRTPKPLRMAHQYNNGVMLFRNCRPVSRWLRKWKNMCEAEYNKSYVKGGKLKQKAMTQPSMVVALMSCEVKLLTLPYEFNYRLTWGAPDAVGPVRIVHGRVDEKKLKELNKGFSQNEIDEPFKFIPDPKQLRIYLTNYDFVLRPYDEDNVEAFAIEIFKRKLFRLLGRK